MGDTLSRRNATFWHRIVAAEPSDKPLEKCSNGVRYTGSPASPGPMSSPWLLPGVFAALLVLLCGMAYMVLAAIRTRHLDKCWHCGASKIRHSKSRWSDTVAKAFLLRPYRCGRCLTRFYAFRTFGPGVPLEPIAPVAVAVALPAPEPALIRKSRLRLRVKVIVRLPWPTDWQSAWELLLAEEQGFLAKPPDSRSRPS